MKAIRTKTNATSIMNSNGTITTLDVQNSPFTYFADTKSIPLPAGVYNFVATSVAFPDIYVDFPSFLS